MKVDGVGTINPSRERSIRLGAADLLREYQFAIDNGDQDRAEALWIEYMVACVAEMQRKAA